MKIFTIADAGDNVSCTVIAPTPKLALEIESVEEYFADQLEQNKEDFDEDGPLKFEAIPYDKVVTIAFDCGTISHTAREWIDIYEGLGSMMLCSSEY